MICTIIGLSLIYALLLKYWKNLSYPNLNSHNLYNTCQSVYRPGHSTETALLKVANDLFLSLSKLSMYVLALLDFSTAFDIIDHLIPIHRLHKEF